MEQGDKIMNEFSFEGLRVFAKFCWNQMDEDMFILMMNKRYHDTDYVRGKWREFSNNSIMFIIGRDERELYQEIMDEIKRTGYNG